MDVVGAAHLSLVDAVASVDPKVTIFEAMLDGWRAQQLGLTESLIGQLCSSSRRGTCDA
jgi:hypothetical protein